MELVRAVSNFSGQIGLLKRWLAILRRPSEKELTQSASVNIVNVLFRRLLGIIIGIFPAMDVKRAAPIYVRYRYYDVFALTSVYVSICVTTSAKEKSLSLIPLMNPVKNHSAMRASRLLATQGCLMNQRLTLKKMNR